MPSKVDKRLVDIRNKAVKDGHWPLATAAVAALATEPTLDDRINVVGAMHEVNCLRNRIAPLWKEWRKDAAMWINRCIERLLVKGADHDFWALAALLGTDVQDLHQSLLKANFTLQSIRNTHEFDSPDVHVGIYSPTHEPMTGGTGLCWAPALEIGWDSKSGEVVDVVRWRTILLQEVNRVGESITGKGSGSYFLRAKLPYGAWRLLHADFNLNSEDVIAMKDTILD